MFTGAKQPWMTVSLFYFFTPFTFIIFRLSKGISMIAAIIWIHVIVSLLAGQTAVAIPGVLAAGVQPVLIREDFVVTEGPVGTADGGLFFSDNQSNRTYRLDLTGNITVFREQTN